MFEFIVKPDCEEKLDILAQSAQFDVCLASCSSNRLGGRGRIRDPGNPAHKWIYPAVTPEQGNVGILKVLQTNRCIHRCNYCVLSANRDRVRRVSISPDDLADIFMRFVAQHLVHGIFISSSVEGRADAAMGRMIATAEILRKKHRFKGYIHIKILPGVSRGSVEYAVRLANRVSVNIEAPTREHLSRIAPDKKFASDLMLRMKWVSECLTNQPSRAKSQTTQFVVGASNETDLEILKAVDWIYREMYVFRAFFSAHQAVGEQQKASQRQHSLLSREHRLYQSDYLLRGYGFRFKDLVFDAEGNLPPYVDPKIAYAMLHSDLYPVDINHASLALLLKVPGIGPMSARRIVEYRGIDPFRSCVELKKAGVVVKRAARYIEFSGKRDNQESCIQQRLFEEYPQSRWCTDSEPYQKEKLGDAAYEYPGQTGKRLLFASGRNGNVVMCR